MKTSLCFKWFRSATFTHVVQIVFEWHLTLSVCVIKLYASTDFQSADIVSIRTEAVVTGNRSM